MNEEKKVTCFTVQQLAAKAINRPGEYQQDVLDQATISGDQICMPIEAFRALRAKWAAFDYEQKYGSIDPKWLPVEFENGSIVRLDISIDKEGKPVIRRVAKNRRTNHGAKPDLVPMEDRPPEEQAQIKDLLKVVTAFFNPNVPCPFGGLCEELRTAYFEEFEKLGGEENCKGCTLSGLQRRYISLVERELKV